jgi:hypothetical protein
MKKVVNFIEKFIITFLLFHIVKVAFHLNRILSDSLMLLYWLSSISLLALIWLAVCFIYDKVAIISKKYDR